ncbi:MAG: hypothetical protein JW928_04460 [Candidatus Aureabacteria bacterium]|nr:hypothetical protein [Candidatus Auribacterota bacterium]
MNSSCKSKKILIFIVVFNFLFLLGPHHAVSQSGINDISIDFVDADIADVVRVLATSQNLNYIIGDNVVGKVTIKLDNVSFETALNSVVAANGYAYKIVENVLNVNTMEKLREEERIKEMIDARQALVTFVFELKYINAEDVIPVLENELSERGKIFALKRTVLGGYKGGELTSSTSGVAGSQRLPTKKEEATRTLVVIDVPTRIEKIQDLIIRLDKLPRQVLIDTKIVEMQMDDTFDFGIKWNFLGGGADGTGGLTVGSSKVSKIITDNLEKVTEGVKEFKDDRGVVPAEGPDFVRLDSDSKRDFPLSYDAEDLYRDSQGIKKEKQTDPVTGLIYYEEIPWGSGKAYTHSLEMNSNVNDTRTFTKSDLKTATLSISDMNLVLNALQANGNVEMVSNPTILTLHNHEASILVGERYPIIQAETSLEGGTNTIESLDHYEPIGVHLQVVPQVMDNGYINMIIRPAVTSLGSEVKGTYISINRISTREANTQAIVRSGETVVIGGLISDRLTKNVSKLPLLGDIPILGWMFKNKRDAVQKINLMVFVTPTVVENEH